MYDAFGVLKIALFYGICAVNTSEYWRKSGGRGALPPLRLLGPTLSSLRNSISSDYNFTTFFDTFSGFLVNVVDCKTERISSSIA